MPSLSWCRCNLKQLDLIQEEMKMILDALRSFAHSDSAQDKEEENHYLKLHGQPIIIHNANQPYVTNADATIKFRKTEDKDDIGVQAINLDLQL
ncbi:hypothetical protein L1049_009640 [Liquidambar formosana]|uniref:Uncharacterized protein n=1 Tax=Liquidambar formosana TaxID=63359 RepID=A0AAP0N648_LIQFO